MCVWGEQRDTHRDLGGRGPLTLFISLWTESSGGKRKQASPSVIAHARIVSDPLRSKWWTHTLVSPTDKWLGLEGGGGRDWPLDTGICLWVARLAFF